MTATALPELDRRALGLMPESRLRLSAQRRIRARSSAWAWNHRRSIAVIVPLALLTIIVRWRVLGHGPALADDEGTYLAQAWSVQVNHALAPYTYWYDHPPLGWFQLAGWTWLTGVFGGHGMVIIAGRHLMTLYAAVDAALIFVLARRLGMRRPYAAGAVFLWAMSPLALGQSVMVYLDNLAMPWLLGALVLAASRRQNLWSHVGAGALFAVALLTKETSILALPALSLLVWQHTNRKTRPFCLTGFWATLVLCVAAYPLLALLKGELFPGSGHVSLFDALRFQFWSRTSTGSALQAHSQSRALVDQWFTTDRWLLILGLLATPIALAVARLRPVGIAMAVLLVVSLRPGYLPQPFIILVLPFAALAIAGVFDALHTRAQRSDESYGALMPLLAGAAALMLLPGWSAKDRALGSFNQTAATAAAEHWLVQQRPQGRLLVDNTIWADLVSRGFEPKQVVWFYKLDYVNNLDPSVRERTSNYSAFQVVVSTPVLRSALANVSPTSLSLVRDALAKSTPVAVFGSGNDRVEIRAISSPGKPTFKKGT